MRLKPVNDKIVVKPTKKDEVEPTAAGIILPDSAKDGGLLEGEVVAVGEGMYSANGTLIPVVVSEGDTILYGKHAAKQEEVTEAGILLPDTVDQGKLMEGEVVAVGQGMWSANGKLIPVVCDVGDKILYNKHAQVYDYDDNHMIMSVNEVLSIVKEK